MTQRELDKVQAFVKFANAKILVVNMLGCEMYYSANTFNQKAIHQPYNEIIKGKCINRIIHDDGIGVVDANNFDALIQNLPEENIKFGHDDYVYFMNVL